jgi:anti-sigma-K factor RskA
MTCEEIAELLPAYALGALDNAEQALVRAHLPTCAACHSQLASYHSVASALALAAAPASPAPSLRDRVLRRAGLPGRRSPLANWLERWRLPRPSSFGLTRLRPAFAAVALLLAVGAGVQSVRLQAELGRQVAVNRSLADQAAAQEQLTKSLLGPGLVVRAIESTDAAPGAEAYLYLNPNGQRAFVWAGGLPALPEGKAYQLWLIQDGRRTSGGLFVPGPDGVGHLAVLAPEPLSSYQSVGVTVEPATGSPGPTGARVLGGPL